MIRQTELFRFIKHHAGKGALAPLTGQDTKALLAFAALVELYAYSDGPGQAHAIKAMHATLQCMQESTRSTAKWCISAIMDFSDMDRVWGELSAATCERCGKILTRLHGSLFCATCPEEDYE